MDKIVNRVVRFLISKPAKNMAKQPSQNMITPRKTNIPKILPATLLRGYILHAVGKAIEKKKGLAAL